MKIINSEELERMRLEGEDFVLLNIMPKEEGRKIHLPGSVHVPFERVDSFMQKVEEIIPHRDEVIVIYGADVRDKASARATELLEKKGYRNVLDFAGGVSEWKDAGYPIHAL